MQKPILDQLAAQLKARRLDALYLTPSEFLKFFTGLDVLHCERFQGLFITSRGDAFYVVSRLNEAEARQALGQEAEVLVYAYDSMDALRPAFQKYALEGAKLAASGTARVVDVVPLIDAFGVRLCDATPLLHEATILKDPEAVEKLRYAAEMTDEVYRRVLGTITPGMTEGQVLQRMGEDFHRLGITESFGGSVSFGANTAMPHYVGTEAVLRENDIVLMDFGCKYQGYHSDMTRTFFIGEPSAEQRQVYETVLAANLQAEAKARPGMTGHDIDALARDFIEAAGYGPQFIHGLGHGVGCCVHEYPKIAQGEARVIDSGMVFSIEPGVYFEGKFGVRIEDIVVMEDNGVAPLNKAPKDMIVV